MKKLLSIIFVLFIALPAVLFFADGSRVKPTVQNPACLRPVPHTGVWLNPNFYDSIHQWIRCTFPFKKQLVAIKNRVDYRLFRTTDAQTIHIGTNGWLFKKETVIKKQGKKEDINALSRKLLSRLHAIEKVLSAANIKFVFTIAPDKASIYPEFTGTHPEDNLLKTFLEMESKRPLNGFVRLDLLLKKEKLTRPDLYGRSDSRWRPHAAAVAASEILKKAGIKPEPHTPAPDPYADDTGDLYRVLMGQEQERALPSVRHLFGPENSEKPFAILYGDAFVDSLLPVLTKHFSKLDAVFSQQVPSIAMGENFAFADVIIIECAQENLRRLGLDLQPIFAKTEPFFENTFKRPLPHDKIQAVSQLSIHMEKDALSIRSTGEKSQFRFSGIQGSTHSIYKMVKLSITSGRPNTMTLSSEHQKGLSFRKKMKPGKSVAVFPLPFSDRVNIIVNPGEHPGVFKLNSVDIIQFPSNKAAASQGKAPPVEKTQDIYTGMALAQTKNHEASEKKSAIDALKQKDPALNMPTILVSDFEEGKIFQRTGESADIAVTGSYTGYPGAIEARVIKREPFEVVMPWTVIQGEPENNVFIGILKNVPQGGWYVIEVRSAIAPWIRSSGANRWGVGMLIACIGQSNMKEWFNTGNHMDANPMLRFYSKNVWHVPGKKGNGAKVLGNTLIQALGCPVGLMDYGVNGSGLTPEADFGKGFWMDDSAGGIYNTFINSIHRTGGSLEFVIFMQGEADAARGFISANQYRHALERFISDKIREDIENRSSQENLPFLMIPMVKRPGGKNSACQSIRNAQMKAIETVKNCYLGAIPLDLKNKGSQHLAPSQYKILAQRTAQTILYILGKRDYHRGPFVSSVSRVNGTTIDVLIEHRKGDDFTPGADITGFEVLSNKKTLPVAGVIRKDSRTIRIKLDAFFIGPFTVRYLYGAMPDTSRPVRDNSPLSLPLEPFIMH